MGSDVIAKDYIAWSKLLTSLELHDHWTSHNIWNFICLSFNVAFSQIPFCRPAVQSRSVSSRPVVDLFTFQHILRDRS